VTQDEDSLLDRMAAYIKTSAPRIDMRGEAGELLADYDTRTPSPATGSAVPTSTVAPSPVGEGQVAELAEHLFRKFEVRNATVAWNDAPQKWRDEWADEAREILVLAAQAPKPASAGGEHWAIRAGDVMADWCNRSGAALRAMMDAYERRIRTECTPEQLAKKPWECAEYIEARRTLDEKPVWTVSIAAEADTAKDGAK